MFKLKRVEHCFESVQHQLNYLSERKFCLSVRLGLETTEQ